jgi:hypothetical protein
MRAKADVCSASGVEVLARRHIHQFFVLTNPLLLGVIEIVFPCGNHNGGDAIADQIAERAPCR